MSMFVVCEVQLIQHNIIGTYQYLSRQTCCFDYTTVSLAAITGVALMGECNKYYDRSGKICGDYLQCDTCREWANSRRSNRKCLSGELQPPLLNQERCQCRGFLAFSHIDLLHVVMGRHLSSCAKHFDFSIFCRHLILVNVIPAVVWPSLLGPPLLFFPCTSMMFNIKL